MGYVIVINTSNKLRTKFLSFNSFDSYKTYSLLGYDVND